MRREERRRGDRQLIEREHAIGDARPRPVLRARGEAEIDGAALDVAAPRHERRRCGQRFDLEGPGVAAAMGRRCVERREPVAMGTHNPADQAEDDGRVRCSHDQMPPVWQNDVRDQPSGMCGKAVPNEREKATIIRGPAKRGARVDWVADDMKEPRRRMWRHETSSRGASRVARSVPAPGRSLACLTGCS